MPTCKCLGSPDSDGADAQEVSVGWLSKSQECVDTCAYRRHSGAARAAHAGIGQRTEETPCKNARRKLKGQLS